MTRERAELVLRAWMELEDDEAATAPPEVLEAMELLRPKTRGDCVDGVRPCPWVSCRHHLYLAHHNTGRPAHECDPHELGERESCVLDVVADHPDGLDYPTVGRLAGCTGSRVQQIACDSTPNDRGVVSRLLLGLGVTPDLVGESPEGRAAPLGAPSLKPDAKQRRPVPVRSRGERSSPAGKVVHLCAHGRMVPLGDGSGSNETARVGSGGGAETGEERRADAPIASSQAAGELGA